MGLVSTWLSGIGLNYAIPLFEAAGIVTPTALAELDVSYFEALGVKDPEDRRKLFYLVQRIKMAVQKEDGSVEHEVDSVLAQTMRSSLERLDDEDDDDSIIDENDDGKPKARKSPRAKENQSNEPQKIGSPRASRISRLPVSPSMRRHKENLRDAAITSDSIDDGFDYDDEEESDNESEEAPAPDNDSDWEADGSTGGDSADDEASGVPQSITHPAGRRTSQRLQEKRQQRISDSFGSSSRRSSLARPAAATNRRSTSNSRRKSTSAVPRTNSFDSASDTSSSVPRRQSGVPMPKSRRPESSKVPAKSMRTGKQLSTIPADSIAPMSPLVDLKESKLATHEETKQQVRQNKTRRRSSSFDRYSGASDSESSNRRLSTIIASEQNRRRARSSDSRKTSRRSRLSKSSFESEHGRKSMNGKPSSTRPSRSEGDSSSIITIQGQKSDNSFKAQIARLREDNIAEHELFADSQSIDTEDELDMRIRVVVRKRPMSRAEIAAAGDVDIVHPLDCNTYGRTLIYQPKTRVDLTKEIETVPFAFDNVFDEKSTNVQIYKRSVRNLIPGLFERQWASVFAYGQTGSGKTYTMMGSNLTGMKDGSNSGDPSNLGLYYMAALDIFHAIKSPRFEDFTVGVSLFEIYGGKLFDLLNDRKQVKCLEDSKGKICFPGLSEHSLLDADQLIEVIERGASNRSTGTTSRNADSSRSHAVMQLHLRTNTDRKKNIEYSRLTFIDLAGSERGADTSSSSRATRMEGAEINTSLLALKEVIRALATGDSLTHVPFRGSKLTQVLKESFVGKNCRSVMIACISPNIGNCEQTLNTLRYADRVKERNAQTGELTIVPSEPTAARRTSNAKFFHSASPHAESPTAGSIAAQELSSHSFESTTSDMLDELLSTPARAASPRKKFFDDSSPDPRLVAQEVIVAHKTAMTVMLDMVKDEMKLVNEEDSGREGLDEYIAKLAELQGKQLDLFIGMREKIREYRAVKSMYAKGQVMAEGGDHNDDDSIEDLRD